MSGHCIREDCWILTGHGCEIGNPDFTKCKNYRTDKETVSKEPGVGGGAVEVEAVNERLPWSGRALGLNDMGLVASRSSTALVALVGPYSAGKTTFLTSMFAHFAKVGLVGENLFAGSWTLEGWENLRRYTEWPTSTGPTFPPHTPDTGDRVPSLLHMAFRLGDGRIADFLFTDAPGEWFTRWIRNQDGEDTAGAKWISGHATSFLFFVDREALAGPTVGKVRIDLIALARLLAENRNGRPVTIVWAKSDIELSPDVENPLRERLSNLLPDSSSFDVSIRDGRSLEVLSMLVGNGQIELSADNGPTPAAGRSAFLAYRSSSSR